MPGSAPSTLWPRSASQVGDLSAITRVVKLVGFVSSVPSSPASRRWSTGRASCSGQIFGDGGQHARSAVGVAVLPLDAPVEVELVVEVG